MVEIWRPQKDHLSYMNDPAYLERHFGALPLSSLRSDGVLGVARFVILPSFSGESINTFRYREHEVDIEVLQAPCSLWYSLAGGKWSPPILSRFTRPLGSLPAPLDRWESLVEVSASAPTVRVAIVDGQEYGVLDGVTYRFSLADPKHQRQAQWSNPVKEASNHVSQVRLVSAFTQVLEECFS